MRLLGALLIQQFTIQLIKVPSFEYTKYWQTIALKYPVNGFTAMTVILLVAIGTGIILANSLPVDFDKLNQQQAAQ